MNIDIIQYAAAAQYDVEYRRHIVKASRSRGHARDLLHLSRPSSRSCCIHDHHLPACLHACVDAHRPSLHQTHKYIIYMISNYMYTT